MYGLTLVTGSSRNTGCEGAPCVYDTRACCSVPTTVKILCGIMLLISAIEIGTEAWIFFQVPWNIQGMIDMGLNTYSISNIRLLKAVSVATMLFGLLRTGSIYYLYTSLTETTLPRVVTARGVCICNAAFNTIMLLILIGFLAPIAVDSALLTIIDSKFFSRFLIGLLSIDFGILICYGLCVVETYRRSVMQSESIPTVKMSEWAARENDKYKVVSLEDEAA